MAGALVNMIETVEAMEHLAPERGAGYGQRLEAAAKQRGKDVDRELLLFALDDLQSAKRRLDALLDKA